MIRQLIYWFRKPLQVYAPRVNLKSLDPWESHPEVVRWLNYHEDGQLFNDQIVRALRKKHESA